jgi:membrane fusion protein, multidrug efflux system
MKKLALYLLVPFILVVGVLYAYFSGGRYITTENAYVRTGIVTVAANTSGEVIEVLAKRNQKVNAGDILLRLSDDLEITKIEQAKANLIKQHAIVAAIKATYQHKQAKIAEEKENLAFELRELKRAQELAKSHNISEAKLDAHLHQVEAAHKTIEAIERDSDVTLSQLGGEPNISPEGHPLVQDAKAMLDGAIIAREYKTVRARTSGTVTNIDLHPGEYIRQGTAAFSMTTDEPLWVEANLKETDLTYIKVGQTVEVFVDAYPLGAITGIISSIDPAAGAEFSILPPQNATGNWVKVTRRFPVQITLDSYPVDIAIRAGMSVEVRIDTRLDS